MAAPTILPEKERLAKYDDAYYLGIPTAPEAESYRRKVIRQSDMVSAVCYAYGYHDYAEVCEVLDIPIDNPRELPKQVDFREQLATIKSRATRIPKLVVDIGAGRGEVDVLFRVDDIPCIGIDPAPRAAYFYAKTMLEWGPILDYAFIGAGAVEGMLLLQRTGFCPDTIMLVETLEHIRPEEFEELWPIIRNVLSSTKGLLIITNWVKGAHPLLPNSSWNHVHRVDDELYDQLCQKATVVFRQDSHLALQF